ncbi:MAG: YbbR-like domain-containing protein [Candidatus Binatia bacterium]
MKGLEREQLRALWHKVRATLLNPERLRRLITHNFALKLLSLLIAFSLWFFVNFGERDTQESLRVPLELRNIPAHLMITSPRVDFIDLRVSGPRALLGRIDHDRLLIPLDLSGVRPGPAVFRVAAESLNLPRGVRTVRINPAQITLELERVGYKSVPVRLRLDGKLPPGLVVTDTKVSPETIRVTGPVSDVQDVTAVDTEQLDISKATPGTLERELRLEPVGEYLSVSADRVAAQVRIEEVKVTRVWKRVQVRVRNVTSHYRVTPNRIAITVRGPKRLVDSLELQPGAVYIDAAGVKLGRHEVKPTVDLPVGVELVSMKPAKVRLSLWKRKRASRGHR